MIQLPPDKFGAQPGRHRQRGEGWPAAGRPGGDHRHAVGNGAAALVVVAVAGLVSSQAYGEIAQLLGLFFILSMPGSAVLVGVVHRVTGLRAATRPISVQWCPAHGALPGRPPDGAGPSTRPAGWGPTSSGCRTGGGWSWYLMAAGIWILLSVDHGLLQAHRSYRPLAGNLLVEGGVRTAAVMFLVIGGFGVVGLRPRAVPERGGGHHHAQLVGPEGLDEPGHQPRGA